MNSIENKPHISIHHNTFNFEDVMALVSVIMPVYNTEKWVEQAIRSVLNQSFSDFEFIIIDDCSTDRSYDICKLYAQKDNRIRLYRNDTNRGVAFCKNRAINLSTTNYIAAQDSDDISVQQRLQLQYSYLLNHENCAVVWGNNYIINEEWDVISHRFYDDNIKNVILKKSPVSHPSTMMRKDFYLEVGGYSDEKFIEDYELWLKLFSKGYDIHNLKEDVLYYRIRPWNQKSYVKETLDSTIKLQQKAYKIFKPSFSDKVYHYWLRWIRFLPEKTIFSLFSYLEYKKVDGEK